MAIKSAIILFVALTILAAIACATPEPEIIEVPVTVIVEVTPTPLPEPTPMSIDLATAERANLWIHLSTGIIGIEAHANPAFDVDQFDLKVFVDGMEYCNTSRIYADDGFRQLSCTAVEYHHRDVQRVSAQTPQGDLRCERNAASSGRISKFACVWR